MEKKMKHEISAEEIRLPCLAEKNGFNAYQSSKSSRNGGAKNRLSPTCHLLAATAQTFRRKCFEKCCQDGESNTIVQVLEFLVLLWNEPLQKNNDQCLQSLHNTPLLFIDFSVLAPQANAVTCCTVIIYILPYVKYSPLLTVVFVSGQILRSYNMIIW